MYRYCSLHCGIHSVATDVPTYMAMNPFRLSIMLLLLLVVQVHPMMIAQDTFRLYLYSRYGNYSIYTTDGENATRYIYPIETEVYLWYDGDFTLNNHPVNAVYKNGTVSIPHIIQTMFARRAINTACVESIQLCYDFTTERTSLTVAVVILALLFLASHGPKGWTLIQSIASDLHRPEIARRVSRSRGPMTGGETSFTTIKKKTSI